MRVFQRARLTIYGIYVFESTVGLSFGSALGRCVRQVINEPSHVYQAAERSGGSGCVWEAPALEEDMVVYMSQRCESLSRRHASDVGVRWGGCLRNFFEWGFLGRAQLESRSE